MLNLGYIFNVHVSRRCIISIKKLLYKLHFKKKTNLHLKYSNHDFECRKHASLSKSLLFKYLNCKTLYACVIFVYAMQLFMFELWYILIFSARANL